MVDPISFGPLRPVEHRKSAAPAAVSTEKTKQVASSARVGSAPRFSLGKLTALARELADAGPPVDHVRIAQIRQAISLGSYRIDANAIADAVLHYYDSETP
jgi:flagellar biosynthesis anti-sigma factor FlgM